MFDLVMAFRTFNRKLQICLALFQVVGYFARRQQLNARERLNLWTMF
jgi:hypothetical protein